MHELPQRDVRMHTHPCTNTLITKIGFIHQNTKYNMFRIIQQKMGPNLNTPLTHFSFDFTLIYKPRNPVIQVTVSLCDAEVPRLPGTNGDREQFLWRQLSSAWYIVWSQWSQGFSRVAAPSTVYSCVVRQEYDMGPHTTSRQTPVWCPTESSFHPFFFFYIIL